VTVVIDASVALKWVIEEVEVGGELFLVGYGTDYAEKYRHLRYIGTVRNLGDAAFTGTARGLPVNLVFRPIRKIRSEARNKADIKSCHTGAGRCPWEKWIPAFAGKTRTGALH
jgi:hypothetical protein